MKYKIGDKVRYDGGDWWFYGTVSAVFEHSICPCYRLNVERMEKKNCKFSITQFEFELETDEVVSSKDKPEWEKSEIEDLKKYYGVLNNEDLSKVLKKSPQAIEEKWRHIKPDQKKEVKPAPELIQMQKSETTSEKKKQERELKQETGTGKSKEIRLRKTTDAWENNLELYRKGKKSNVLNAWKSKNRKDYQIGILAKDKYEKLMAINFPFDVDKRYKPTTRKTKPEKVELPQKQEKEPRVRKTTDAWDRNLEGYSKGEKSSAIFTWSTYNRKQFKAGKLSEEKIGKLKEINFPFDLDKKKKEKVEKPQKQKKEPTKRKRGEAWDENLEAYRKGEKSNLISTWIAYNRKQYKEGKLPEGKFKKLIEINFPFEAIKDKKPDSWDRQLEEWKNGDRKSKQMQQWRQRSIRQFEEGKLSGDRIVKLKEVGILK